MVARLPAGHISGAGLLGPGHAAPVPGCTGAQRVEESARVRIPVEGGVYRGTIADDGGRERLDTVPVLPEASRQPDSDNGPP
ncbi:hypothetical protein AB0953_13190 [Streptomyces sp. NPDC046866]|uniref:hypothetical protein n=1 Tax=Streptomyces sp. NPDC046866 TaxID=3154921 RepID=UPI00345580DB